MTAHNSCSYLDYLGKLVPEYSNADHRFIGKKSFDADFSSLTEKSLRRILTVLNLKLVIEQRLLSIKMFLAKVTPNIGQDEYFWLILL